MILSSVPMIVSSLPINVSRRDPSAPMIVSWKMSFIPITSAIYSKPLQISTGFVESTVNEVISKRMKKKQQMRWTKQGAHLLLQVRIKTLNGELKEIFKRWYPKMVSSDKEMEIAS